MTNLTPDMLTTYLRFAQTRLLDLVDLQHDFMAEDGALAIHPKYGCKEDASEIIEPVDRFLAAVPEHAFDLALVKFDTHFRDEYHRSPESAAFPSPHCIYGTPGWDLAVDIAPLAAKIPTYMLAKNEFDMWGSNPTGIARDRIAFAPGEARAYDNLFHVMSLEAGDDPAQLLANAPCSLPRDDFAQLHVGSHTVVVLLGVASDFCNHQAMLGYLKRGATVIVAEDLTRGIGGAHSPAPDSGATRDVIAATIKANPLYTGRLHSARSHDILTAMHALAGARPTKFRRDIAGLAL